MSAFFSMLGLPTRRIDVWHFLLTDGVLFSKLYRVHVSLAAHCAFIGMYVFHGHAFPVHQVIFNSRRLSKHALHDKDMLLMAGCFVGKE